MGVILVEAAILLGGAFLYWRAAMDVERAAGVVRGRANLVTATLVASGLVVLVLDVALA